MLTEIVYGGIIACNKRGYFCVNRVWTTILCCDVLLEIKRYSIFFDIRNWR